MGKGTLDEAQKLASKDSASSLDDALGLLFPWAIWVTVVLVNGLLVYFWFVFGVAAEAGPGQSLFKALVSLGSISVLAASLILMCKQRRSLGVLTPFAWFPVVAGLDYVFRA